MNRIREYLTRKVGPLPLWVWVLIVGAIGAMYVVWSRSRADIEQGGDGSVSLGPLGEFSSRTSTERVDPETGERYTSEYQASGPTGGLVTPGALGYAASPMPYSGGDIYLNMRGDGRNMNSATPWPPAQATGPGPHPDYGATVGGYWWTPKNLDDMRNLIGRSGLNPNPNLYSQWTEREKGIYNAAVNRSKIMFANPQIDWSKPLAYGTPIYIPHAAGWWQDEGELPPNASLNAPSGYRPPTQQTSVQVPAA